MPMKALLIMLCILPTAVSAERTFSITDLRCEDLVDPLGIDIAKPRLSWRMRADYNGAAQKAYQVLCATSPKLLKEGSADLWDSGKIETDQSQHVVYAGKKLERGAPCYWTVRIWPARHSPGDGGNEKGGASDWSQPGTWTAFDMTSSSDWKAKWITQNHKGPAVPWLRRSFQLDAVPARAYIYVNALGYFQLFINGKRVGSDEFAPHVGQYDKRTFCLTYDVAKYLSTGKNAIGFWLGSAWNRGGAGVSTTPSVRAQLEMRDAGGKTSTIITDENWRAKPSSMSCTGAWKWGNFGGEVHDARLDEPGWANADYDDSAWSPAAPGKVSTAVVSAAMLQPSRVIATLTPVKITKLSGKAASPGGAAAATTSWLIDMGKAMTGTFEITFPSAPKGHKVSMEFGDAMGKGGRVNSFKQASTYICRGSGTETFRNRFNYASGRYILIKNAPGGGITPADIKGFLISTELPKASTFSCSDETLNKIYGMMEHTLRCLMLGGYQVDCHSRERQGYGGDGHSSLDTTLCLLRADTFYRKWTRDWVDQQQPDGVLTHTSPASGHGGGPFWCGFLTAATLKHYQHYGDLGIVEHNYPAIKKWFELAQSKTVDGIQQKFTGQRWYLGDWASPKGVNDRGSKGNAETFIQPYMVYALKQAAQLADALGKTDDANQFRGWAEARSKAMHSKFYDPQNKKYGSGDQVTYILPLIAGVVPNELEKDVFAGFEKTLKEKNKGHLATGLSGTYMMVQYLQKIGRDDLIYLFASKKTYPSWGYMIEKGATATWEHWGGQRSRIHNCFNNIASWFIQGLAGIRPDLAKPGFKNAVIKPAVLKELSYVKASHDTLYGTIHISWKRDGETLTMKISIPANSTATIHVPAADVKRVTVNGKAADAASHVKYLKTEAGRVLLQVASGSYEIVIR
jgi:alpha-L-rhamnosidase